MKRNIFLIISDEEIALFERTVEKRYPFKEGTEHIQATLKKDLSLIPKTSLSVLIDRTHQDIREEQLPPLLPWDRWRFLIHKREEWASQGKVPGYRFFKQDKKTFFQWVTLSSNDALMPWLSWLQSLSHPLGGVFFASLEAGRFLHKHFPPSEQYHMLIYKLSPQKIRYVIFKGKRLLLFRPWSGEEDLRTSLHFLHRAHPDIHEKLQILNLIPSLSLSFPHVVTLSEPRAFIDFLITQKGSSLSLNICPSGPSQWAKRGTSLMLTSFLFLTGFSIYQTVHYKRQTQSLLPQISILERQIQEDKRLLKNKDVALLRAALARYDHLTSRITDPFVHLENLAPLLHKHHLHLETLSWSNEQGTSLELGFSMKNDHEPLLSHQFNALLSSVHQTFPQSHIHILEGPFKSGSHETYKHPSDMPIPIATIRVVFP